MAKCAVIVIDLQNEYLATGKVPLVGIDEAVRNAARVVTQARSRGNLVIYVRHESADPQRPVFQPGSDGVQFIVGMAPGDDDPVVVKHTPNAFLRTSLQEILQQHHIEAITLVGAMSHMCIDATARAASDLGYRTTVVHDACATRDLRFLGETVPAAQVHGAFMAALESSYGTVVSTREWLPLPEQAS